MNVFEDLVVELKEENLLERTIIDDMQPSADDGQDDALLSSDLDYECEAPSDEAPVIEGYNERAVEAPLIVDLPDPVAKKPRNGKEFYRKRAVNEVSNLQMVEHVLTGVEREFMKIAPKTFDDFKAKQALHGFLNLDENENSAEHAESEFTLMQETEAWCTALAERDTHVPVSSLRLFCENSRPALSSQALLALARFYRNLPFSENVRAKFDFIVTRLFSKAEGKEKRSPLFTREEAVGHINEFYNDWSSIALYSAENDESKLLLTALSFEDLANEAEQVTRFDQLIEGNFFGRMRVFKESISELFYAPIVVAAAIEGNIRIGNVFVDLLAKEQEKMDDERIMAKYCELDDQQISNAAGRTLGLFKEAETNDAKPFKKVARPERRIPHKVAAPTNIEKAKPEPGSTEKKPQFFGNFVENAKAVNKWFLMVAALLAAASIGLYIWSNIFASDEVSTSGVQLVDIENTILKEHIKTARISGETYYAFMLPSWDLLPKEKRQEFLQKVLQSAQEKGCRQVTLTNTEGKNVGYASATRLDVVMP